MAALDLQLRVRLGNQVRTGLELPRQRDGLLGGLGNRVQDQGPGFQDGAAGLWGEGGEEAEVELWVSDGDESECVCV